ncbi:MAG: hypothetical protein A3H28_02560 [Acidobacteria bacterium RIFCSPLOWO2_02_FULL_61_28]|nr:MAG: hypothetical protein A3H28_02560 [Acidobacteria bacterium RIFCSPLOWO2_02_FULL_61_28]OFW36746.1 MAG: hypothetical protein A3J28_09250 [Acidobacteria bacterium RIFCSPLOWO2_12_FULL_60_22]
MTDNLLIDRLAQEVLHWCVAPDRFLTGNRSWIPKWKFNPLERLEDAFRLLDHSQPMRYAISQIGGAFQVEVERSGKVGKASGDSKPRAITLALARSLGLEL